MKLKRLKNSLKKSGLPLRSSNYLLQLIKSTLLKNRVLFILLTFLYKYGSIINCYDIMAVMRFAFNIPPFSDFSGPFLYQIYLNRE